MAKDLPDKLPPQNIEAEQSLLGCLMIDKKAIFKVADFIRSEDFYRKVHQQIYQAVLDLFEKGEPVDLLSLSNRLREKEQFEEVGGSGYLTELVNSVPTASHVMNYAQIVQRKRILRDLIDASHDIGILGYSESEDIDIILDKAENRIFTIAQKNLSQNFLPVKASLEEAFERIDKLSKHEGGLRGLETGFKDLDNMLGGLQKSDLIILASRPSMGKSSLALNIASYAAISNNIPVGIFSLEMARDQVVDRLIATESNVDLWRLKMGKLSGDGENDDFSRIRQSLDVLNKAPIYIDDTASLNILQMRAMARRLQAQKELGLIIIDYLQLMEPRNPMDSAVRQVTEISRSLKILARELNVPVLAISQLSRAVEQRSPQIPRLADLRESGCLAGDTLIMRANTGERVQIKSLVGKTNIPIYSLDENLKIKEMKISKVFSSGKKMLYELKTRSGRKIKASANHPFRKLDGWHQLDQLSIGDFIATPRKLSPQSPKNELTKDEIILLPHLLGDGCVLPNQPIHYTSGDYKNIQNYGLSWRGWAEKYGMSYCGSTLFKHSVSRERMTKIVEFMPALKLENLAQSNIFWDEIISITPLRVEEVFDATVPGTNNFIANDIVVHNSLEQDADVVLFIYREDRYHAETEKKNIADIIVAKHRNGPVGKVELYFDDSRVAFRNLETRFEQ